MALVAWQAMETYDRTAGAVVWLRDDRGNERPGSWRDGAWRMGATDRPLGFEPTRWRAIAILEDS